MALLVGLLGGVAALGALYLSSAWTPAPTAPTARTDTPAIGDRISPLIAPLSAGVLGTLVALVVTGWIVGAVAGMIAGVMAVSAWRRRGSGQKLEQARIAALASWCEQLRDLLSAEHGIIGTVTATAKTCPEEIRSEVNRLATRLSRQSPSSAIRQFAAEIDDPSGDLIASVLHLAMSRSSRTSELLSELALTIRDRAAMRLRVEAERASQRSEARFIVGFSAAVLVGVLVFARESEFLGAYDDAAGQLVLALVISLFVAGVWWMSKLTRFDRPTRILSIGELEEDE